MRYRNLTFADAFYYAYCEGLVIGRAIDVTKSVYYYWDIREGKLMAVSTEEGTPNPCPTLSVEAAAARDWELRE